MAIDMNAEDYYYYPDLHYADVFPDKPSSKLKNLDAGKENNNYFQEINLHGSRKEVLNFLNEISCDFPEKNIISLKFDKETGMKSAYVDYERAEIKVENLELKKAAEIINEIVPGIYVVEVSDGSRSIGSFYNGAYQIETKENALRKEDIEFLLNSAVEIPVKEGLESYAIQSYEMNNAFDTKQRAEFIPNADDESIVVKFSSDDSNGIEPSFKEQVENVVKAFPVEYTVKMNEPYLGKNKYEVSNYVKERKDGDLEITGIPKNIETDEKAKETFNKMKALLNNTEANIFAIEPKFALKVLEGTYDKAVTAPIKFGKYIAQKMEEGGITFVRTQNTDLNDNWRNYENIKGNTSDILMVGNEIFGMEGIISNCGIEGLEDCYMTYSPTVAGYETVNFARKNNLKLLSVDNEDFSPYGFKNDETWALIDKKNIKIAISEKNYEKLLKQENGSEKKVVSKIYEQTGLKDTMKRFENAEIQIFRNSEYWNNKFFSGKGMKDKIVLKTEVKKEKMDTKEKAKLR